MIELGIKPALPLTARRICVQSLLLALVIEATGGCMAKPVAPPVTDDKSMAVLANKLQALEYQLLATQVALRELGGDETTSREALSRQLASLNDEVGRIPEALTAICNVPANANPPEGDQAIQPVVMSGEKMVVGEMERVWVDPPGATLIARVDTGAQSSSLHAENLVEFERDGDDWVRFDLILNDEVTTLERPVVRYVRVYQQADPEGSMRPVVKMRLRLGDVKDTFEFTLADRAHLDSQMLLGRNFLSDMALVDVGKQFVQPPYKPKRK